MKKPSKDDPLDMEVLRSAFSSREGEQLQLTGDLEAHEDESGVVHLVDRDTGATRAMMTRHDYEELRKEGALLKAEEKVREHLTQASQWGHFTATFPSDRFEVDYQELAARLRGSEIRRGDQVVGEVSQAYVRKGELILVCTVEQAWGRDWLKQDQTIWPTFEGPSPEPMEGVTTQELFESMRCGPDMFRQEYLNVIVEPLPRCKSCGELFKPPEGWESNRCPPCHEKIMDRQKGRRYRR